MEQFKRIALRFTRGAVAGGLASVVGLLSAGVDVTDPEGLKKLGFAMAVSFMSGSLLALDKLLREYLNEGQES